MWEAERRCQGAGSGAGGCWLDVCLLSAQCSVLGAQCSGALACRVKEMEGEIATLRVIEAGVNHKVTCHTTLQATPPHPTGIPRHPGPTVP